MFGDNVTLVSNIDLPKRKLAFNLQHATKAMCEQTRRRAPLQLRSDMCKMITLGLLFLTIMKHIGHQWSKHPNTTPPCHHPSHTKARCESAQPIERLYLQVWLRCGAWCRCRLSKSHLQSKTNFDSATHCAVFWAEALRGRAFFTLAIPGLLDSWILPKFSKSAVCLKRFLPWNHSRNRLSAHRAACETQSSCPARCINGGKNAASCYVQNSIHLIASQCQKGTYLEICIYIYIYVDM